MLPLPSTVILRQRHAIEPLKVLLNIRIATDYRAITVVPCYSTYCLEMWLGAVGNCTRADWELQQDTGFSSEVYHRAAQRSAAFRHARMHARMHTRIHTAHVLARMHSCAFFQDGNLEPSPAAAKEASCRRKGTHTAYGWQGTAQHSAAPPHAAPCCAVPQSRCAAPRHAAPRHAMPCSATQHCTAAYLAVLHRLHIHCTAQHVTTRRHTAAWHGAALHGTSRL